VELTHEFTVPASVEDAWAAFNDLERITPCFPGAALTSFDGETFAGGVKVKLGPISMQYTGTGKFLERDDVAHRAVIEAKGKDKRGNGTAAATVTAELADAGDKRTNVRVRTDLNVTGKPAQFGRGVMQDVSDKLLGQFATCLESRLAAPEASESSRAAAADEAVASGVPPENADAAEPAGGAEPAGTAESAVTAEPAVASEPAATAADGGGRGEAATAEPPEATSPAARHGAAASASSPGRLDQAPAAELDLASTMLPILLKRLGPQLVAVALLVWVVRRWRRRSRQG
jgi:carbon monoxide dehydrogenase subunit G